LFNKHYQSELAFLREMGREFGKQNPSIGGMLAERGGDPDVERLLEGFAFLTARIRERMDAAIPEVVHGLSDLLLPHYLRPLPATTLIEFTPQQRTLRGRHRIARGTPLASVPVEGTPCLFRTTSELDLLPLTLNDVALEYPAAATPLLKAGFQLGEGMTGELFKGVPLRLYLHGELSLCSTLLLWFLRYCKGIEVRTPGQPHPVRLPPSALRPIGFDEEHGLFPWGVLAPPSYRLLQEYYTLPQKFLFLELSGLDGALGQTKDKFELRFLFERPPALPTRLPKDVLKLHCVPAVNLFTSDAEPIRMNAPGEEHLVRASETDPMHMEVYSVDSVEG